jgi:Domain of unknown function (DUF4136)
MNRIAKFTLLAILAGGLLTGCYPDGPDYTEELDVVYTTYDDEYDFVSKGTYAMPDQIVVDIEIDNGDTTYVYMKDIYATPILQKIEDNMTALGYQRVDVSADPDLLMMPAGMTSTTYYYYYWYCWWYGGYWGGWGWYYPPYYSVSSYTTGSLILVLSDPNVDSPINRSLPSWICAMNGLLSGGYDLDRVLDGIDQGFTQSPYLRTN